MSAGTTFPPLARGLVAILRGLEPENAVATAEAIFAAGIEAIEVPLNSPDPFRSIGMIARALPTALIGAGTVLTAEDVERLDGAGGRLLVSPNIDADVMRAAARFGMVTMPGVFTPSEALLALKLGASALKFFPASALGPKGISAIMAVLPRNAIVGAVGGVSDKDFADYGRIGVRTFGLGSSLFAPGLTVDEIAARAKSAVAAWDAAFRTD